VTCCALFLIAPQQPNPVQIKDNTVRTSVIIHLQLSIKPKFAKIKTKLTAARTIVPTLKSVNPKNFCGWIIEFIISIIALN